MYCADCKQYFEEPVVTPMEQETGYVGVFCPCCGSDFIEETTPCKCCGEEALDDFCDTCKENLAEALEDIASGFNITADVLEDMICEYYGY